MIVHESAPSCSKKGAAGGPVAGTGTKGFSMVFPRKVAYIIEHGIEEMWGKDKEIPGEMAEKSVEVKVFRSSM